MFVIVEPSRPVCSMLSIGAEVSMHRVLVIDDEEMCGVLDEFLRFEGFAVESLHNDSV
jgi:hypothetical protein